MVALILLRNSLILLICIFMQKIFKINPSQSSTGIFLFSFFLPYGKLPCNSTGSYFTRVNKVIVIKSDNKISESPVLTYVTSVKNFFFSIIKVCFASTHIFIEKKIFHELKHFWLINFYLKK